MAAHTAELEKSTNGHKPGAIHSIRSLQAKHRTTVDVYKLVKRDGFGEGDLVLDILPMKASARPVLKKFEEVSKSENWEERIDGIVEYLLEIVYAWNMTYGEGDKDADGNDIAGKPLPLNAENVDEMGSVIHGDMVRAIYASFDVGEGNAETSTT